MRLVFLLVTSALTLFSCASKKYNEDLNYTIQQLEKRHPNLHYKISSIDLSNKVKELQAEGIDSKEELIIALMKTFSLVGDSHTQVSRASIDFKQLAVRFYRADDRLFIIGVEPQDIDLLGSEVIDIDGAKTADVLKYVDTLVAAENSSHRWNVSAELLQYPQILNSDQIRLKLKSKSGEKEMTFVPPEGTYDTVGVTGNNPLWLSQPKSVNYWFKILDKDVLYFQYNSCREMKNKSFNSFVDEMIKATSKNQKIIVDLRRNSGGNSEVISPFFDALKKKKIKTNQVLVLISRRTFSSALLNAVELKEDFKAILLGEPTGGAPTHFGDQKSFTLPHSQIEIMYSTKFFKNNSVKTDSLYPDVSVQPDIEKMVHGEDPVLDAALKFQN